jgi:hypothetical protein
MTTAQRNAEYRQRVEFAATAIASGSKVTISRQQLKGYKAKVEDLMDLLLELVMEQGVQQAPGSSVYLSFLVRNDQYVISRTA